MKPVLIFLLVCVFWPFSAARADMANGCPDFEEPVIHIKPLARPPVFDVTRTLKQLRAMASSGDEERFSSMHQRPVGLTSASLKLDANYDIVTRMEPNGVMVCAQITHMTLSLGFDDTIVYLAREMPYNSCSYRTVMNHELQHVQTDERLVRHYARLLPDTLRKAVREIGVVRAGSSAAAQKRIEEIVRVYMSDLSKNLASVRQTEQKKIDTKDEYERLSQSCGSEFSKIFSASN